MGGWKGIPDIVFTDNYPLDEGKIHVREGGIRVPFLISGPKIASGIKSDVVVNGLDFYPTILGWTDTSNSASKFWTEVTWGIYLRMIQPMLLRLWM